MKKWVVPITLTTITLICVLTLPLWAQYAADARGVERALREIIKWLSKGLGGAMVIIGLIIVGIRMSMHDPEALRKGIWVIIGGIIIFLAENILGVIQSLAGK